MLIDCEYCAENGNCRYMKTGREDSCPYRRIHKDVATVRLVNALRCRKEARTDEDRDTELNRFGVDLRQAECRRQDVEMLRQGGTVYVWRIKELAKLIDLFPNLDVGRCDGMYVLRCAE